MSSSCSCPFLCLQEAERATAWIENSFTAAPNTTVNLFETTIRVLGGLLSAFHLSDGNQVLLLAAVDLGLRLLVAFDTPSGLPLSDVHLRNITARGPLWTTLSSLAEMMTLTLEFSYLAQVRHHFGARALSNVHLQDQSRKGAVDGFPGFCHSPLLHPHPCDLDHT